MISFIWNTCHFRHCFRDQFQAYQVVKHEADRAVCAYENIVDFNIFHIHEDSTGEKYIPVKYDINDLIEQHVIGRNPMNF